MSSSTISRSANRIIFWLCLLSGASALVMNEAERLKGYHDRNYTWPLEEVVPNTEGWRRLMYRRMAQVERLTTQVGRYDGWVHTMAAALISPNFTENGWGLTRAPAGLVQELKDALHKGLEDPKEEKYINVIRSDHLPYFVRTDELNLKVLRELKPMHEAWSGVNLTGATAYGLRAYRNTSSLYMHVDKLRTHIISCILHVDHSEDSEPWPIFIEDFQGNTNEVVLESGDMLFYESSKCNHGRPRPFVGSWYSSIFVHYYPTDWDGAKMDQEIHYAIPPHWDQPLPLKPDLEELVMSGTSMYEPTCPDQWCASKDSVKWYGPAKEGVVITTGYKEEEEEAKEGPGSEEL